MGVRILKCFQCNHTWPTSRSPDQCPKCASKDWNKPDKKAIIR